MSETVTTAFVASSGKTFDSRLPRSFDEAIQVLQWKCFRVEYSLQIFQNAIMAYLNFPYGTKHRCNSYLPVIWN